MRITQPMTILLISAEHANWVGLQRVLRKQRRVHVIGEIRQREEALRGASAAQPDSIFVGSDLPGVPVVPLARELRVASPTSHLVVAGRLLTSAEHDELMTLKARGFLLWNDLDEDSVPSILGVVRRGLYVASEAVVERLGQPERRRWPRRGDIVLEPLERDVLRGLCAGLRQYELARVERVSITTIERTIHALCGKVGVPTTCALCAQAGRLGFIE